MKNMFKIKDLISANRQTGTTTALIKAVKETGGYLIVSQLQFAANLIKKDPELKGHILTLGDIDSDRWIGNAPGPLFFDTTAVYTLVTNPQDDYVYALATNSHDGYKADGYQQQDGYQTDGYQQKCTKQLNVRLTVDDMNEIKNINKCLYEEELTDSTVGRILLRKGIQWYKRLIKMSYDNFSVQ